MTESVSQSYFSSRALRCRQAQAVRDGASSHKTDYVAQVLGTLICQRHQNRFIGSKACAVLLIFFLSLALKKKTLSP